MKTLLSSQFLVHRDEDRCIQCQVCVNQCSFGANCYDAEENEVKSREELCVGCHRCVVFCPTNALRVTYNPLDYREQLQLAAGHHRGHQQAGGDRRRAAHRHGRR